MNVVFLLLATAAGTGSPPLPPPSPSYGDGCGAASSCDSCCHDKPGLKDRLRGLFAKKGDCCDAAPPTCCTPAPAPCCKPAPCCTPAPAPCCAPAPTCCDADPCAQKECLFSRFKGLFSKKSSCCCETASPCCGDGHLTATPVPANAGPAPHALPAPGPGPVYPPQRAPLPQGQPMHHGAVINPQPILTPAPAGNGGQVIIAPQNTGGPINTPKALPAGKPAEQIKKTPNEEKNAKPVKEQSRLMPTPVVQPAAAKAETEVKNPF